MIKLHENLDDFDTSNDIDENDFYVKDNEQILVDEFREEQELINSYIETQDGNNFGFSVGNLIWKTDHLEYKPDVLHMNPFSIYSNSLGDNEKKFYIEFNLITENNKVSAIVEVSEITEYDIPLYNTHIGRFNTNKKEDMLRLKNILGDGIAEIQDRLLFAQEFMNDCTRLLVKRMYGDL